MILIPTPSSAYAQHKVSLAGQTYIFTFRFNSYSKRWYLDISLNGIVVRNSEIILEGGILFHGSYIDNFDHGKLFVVRAKETTEPCGRYNFGIDKDYVLAYVSKEELAALS